MAYDLNKPACLVVQGIGGAGPRIWQLTGTDATTVVDTSGYISDAKKLGMKVGDVVLYTKTDTKVNSFHNVININTNGSADLSDALAVTSTNTD